MPVRHSLLLLVFFLLFFAPGLEHWMRSGAGAWHRPLLVWGVIIALVYLGQRRDRSHNA